MNALANKHALIFLLFFAFGQFLSAQIIDTTTYLNLIRSDRDKFIDYAKSAGLTVDFDSTSQTLFAKSDGCVYSKPLNSKKNNIENYELVLIVSTLNKENNKLILRNAIENSDKKGTWTDKEYLYVEWAYVNPFTKEMWYKVIVYKNKNN